MTLSSLKKLEAAARKAVSDMCQHGRWTMKIPADPEHDSDLVISRALDAMSALLEVAEAAKRWHQHDRLCVLGRFAYGQMDKCSCGLNECMDALSRLEGEG